MDLGGHVFYWDWENGRFEMTRRLLALGATADLLSSQFHYMEFPDAPDWDVIDELWDEFPEALGIWDSTRGVMNSMGLNENDAFDNWQFLVPLVRFALTRAVPHIVIDHVTKNTTGRTGYGRGWATTAGGGAGVVVRRQEARGFADGGWRDPADALEGAVQATCLRPTGSRLAMAAAEAPRRTPGLPPGRAVSSEVA